MNKKGFRNTLTVFIVLLLMISMYTVAFAKNDPTSLANEVGKLRIESDGLSMGTEAAGLGINSDIDYFEDERVETAALKTIVVDPSIPEDAEPMREGAYEEISLEDAIEQNRDVLPLPKAKKSNAMPFNIDSSDIKEVNGLSKQNAVNAVGGAKMLVAKASTIIDDEFTGVNASAGSMELYGYFVLYPNEIMQIGMENPGNNTDPMDYDLYLCEYNLNNGDITIADESLYKSNYYDNTKTLDEGLNVTNKTGGTKAYVLAVHSKVGSGSNKPYTIYYSIDSTSNINYGENDQNVTSYCATITPGQYISGLAMNSRSDVDWFALYVEIPSAYYSYGVNITAGNNNVEVYEHLGNLEFKLRKPYSGNKVLFKEVDHGKTFFIKVFSKNRNNHAFNVYTLSAGSVDHSTKPRSIEITGYSCQEQPDNNYVLWPEGNHYSYSGSWLDIRGILKDAFGNGVGAGHKILSAYKSRAWYEKTGGQQGFLEEKGVTSSNGTFTIHYTNLPPCIWDRQVYNPVSNLIHYYSLCDVSVGLDDDNNIMTDADTIYMWSHAHQPF